jgi:hypothetical protein
VCSDRNRNRRSASQPDTLKSRKPVFGVLPAAGNKPSNRPSFSGGGTVPVRYHIQDVFSAHVAHPVINMYEALFSREQSDRNMKLTTYVSHMSIYICGALPPFLPPQVFHSG